MKRKLSALALESGLSKEEKSGQNGQGEQKSGEDRQKQTDWLLRKEDAVHFFCNLWLLP